MPGYSLNGSRKTLSRSLLSMSFLLRCHGHIYILYTHRERERAKEQNLTVSSELTQGGADIEKSLLIGIVCLGRFHKDGEVCMGLTGWAEMGSHEDQFKQYSGRSYLYLGVGTLANKVIARDSYSLGSDRIPLGVEGWVAGDSECADCLSDKKSHKC